ncbi:universal stress protein [Carboxylicivirga sp. M1479]|uniref:universal stress protein n=1 Tax=Carboxylicivirga sp. M1479 TaxID=2594476 RepID=UPI00117878EA|nr:universal stress protein [Carboxylicivirga sp. M1479]TRX71731.1 universal stress protein [Carboxylicivirga sp. M1479]
MVRIFVPINFSDYSINALRYAINLGKKVPSSITLLSCCDVLQEKDQESDLAKTENRLKEFVASTIQKYTSASDSINFIYRVECGYPEDVIVEIGNIDDPDVIIMGTLSKGETIKELLGSVTSDVIKNAKVPVLAVPAASQVDTEKISHVLFVTDFGERDYRSLHKLIRLITPFQTKIFATHFKASQPDKWDKKRMEEMRLYCAQTYRNYHINFDIISGEDFVSDLDAFIELNSIDLIAMTRHKRTMISNFLHPSITRKMLFHTDIPLLVFHE